jgi:hypothetical protein
MAVDTRPTTLTTVHNYNLRNQGWPYTFACARHEDGNETSSGDNDSVQVTDPVRHTHDKVNFYPSNADIIYLAKLGAADKPEAIGSYSPWSLRKNATGNTLAARGHFVINAFDRNRQAVSGINSIYNPDRDKEEDRPVSVAFYAGRVWYCMPDGRLYFSQTLGDLIHAGHCYQEADPTAEDINELVATDGGEIDITGISRALKLMPVRAELIIMSDNGVWSVSGASDKGFTATDQEIRKITNIGAVGRETVVTAEGTIFYWSTGGIYTLVENEATGFLEPQNITENTIQTLYIGIPEQVTMV